ncbi:D-alanyl-D-alanine carboxypeptidase family protein [Paenibacillus lentus]|uniref:D-alanyl-D-alanine carboxypeptidase n=1 Tax=Paenibacillus lentus TaxID=1338368 RepID=A0A3Q8S592_9BACL|nr:D-alanyl-D-alanine carboxypeptidase family protein [Paenibacillus lentus]AZK47137.1 D-alanyl-D-alanine carboxypeptidase [Paenibacillus lentus]
MIKRSIFRFSFTGMMVISLLLTAGSSVGAVENNKPRPPSMNARAASLIDVKSGRILYSHHGDVEMPVASLTKIMTAIVAIEHGKLDEMVSVSKNAYRKEGSSIYLELGEEMTLENMLYGLMLRSGNDAATAIAEHVGGSEEGFVHLMNEKVKMLGLKHTQFRNPHGLDAKGHYSSANDLAVITAYSLQNPVFKEIVKTPSKKAPNPNNPWDYKWDNKNKMLRLYEGADGVKTGYTKTARRCLVSSASRAGQQLAVVTLNDGDDWNDHAKLLDYGFAYYPLKEIIEEGQPVQNEFVTGSGFSYALASGEFERIQRKLFLKNARANDFGYRGQIIISLDGRQIGRVPIYEKGSFIPSPDPARGKPTSRFVIARGSLGNAFTAVIRSLFFVD